MANKTNDKKPTLADEFAESERLAREEYERMTPEEQKQYREAMDLMQKRMDSMNYY